MPSEGGQIYSGSQAIATPSNPDLLDADGFTIMRGSTQPPAPVVS